MAPFRPFRLPLIIAAGRSRATNALATARLAMTTTEPPSISDGPPRASALAPGPYDSDLIHALARLAVVFDSSGLENAVTFASLSLTPTILNLAPQEQPTPFSGTDFTPRGAEILFVDAAAAFILLNPLLAHRSVVSVRVESGLGTVVALLSEDLLGIQGSAVQIRTQSPGTENPGDVFRASVELRTRLGDEFAIREGSSSPDHRRPRLAGTGTADSSHASRETIVPLQVLASRRRVTGDTESIDVALGSSYPWAIFESWSVDIDYRPGRFAPSWRAQRDASSRFKGTLPDAITLNTFSREGVRTICVRATDVCGCDYEDIVVLPD